MKRIISITAIVAFALTSCEKIETDNNLQENSINSTIDINASRSIRPVILGNQKQNPFSLENMKIALDTLKGIVEQSDQDVIKSKSMEEFDLEATDLYVRFLPEDSTQFQKLINDTTLVLYDYPLDYEILQTGDYYIDTAVNNGFTWYYSVVKPYFQPPEGIGYEMIEELFIPENSKYYSVEDVGFSSKSTQSANRRVNPMDNNILCALYIVSFTLTGNEKELQPFNISSPQFLDDDSDSPIQKSTINNCTVHRLKILGRVYSWTTCDPYYQPDGFIRIETPTGDVGVKGVIVRMRRWFTSVDARTSSSGYYSTTERFNSILIGNNVEYNLVFDGRNSDNTWTLNKSILGSVSLYINSISLGNHSPAGLTIKIRETSGAWGRSVLSNAIYDYCNIARADGVALPPPNLDIANRNTDNSKLLFPEMSNGWLAPNLMLYHKSGLSSYYSTVANTWHELIFTSLYNRLVSQMGSHLADATWNRFYNQFKDEWDEDLYDCSCARIEGMGSGVSQRAVLFDAWLNFRKADIIQRHLANYVNHTTQNTYLIPYVDALKKLKNMGCLLSILEKHMVYSIDDFKASLVSQYPNLAHIINSIPSSPQKKADEFTFITFNILRSKSGHNQSDAIQKIARTIACLNPDIVFLQEIYGSSNFNDLKGLTGMDGVFHHTYIEATTKYGIGVLWSNRLGTPSTRYVELGFDGAEDRGFSIAEFPNFVCISTHWCVKSSNNRNIMSEKLKEISFEIKSKTIFVGGDFNAKPQDNEIINLTNSGFKILNDFTNLQGAKSCDMIMEYNKTQDVYTIVSRGSKFPIESWRTTGSPPYATSDHSPYYVVLKKN